MFKNLAKMQVIDLSKDKHVNRLLTDMTPISVIPFVERAVNELDFLKTVDRHRHFYEDDFVRDAIVRYEKYWLPFLAAHSKGATGDEEFTPPLDIHWVWHVHMLAPVAYSADCLRVMNRVAGHRLMTMAMLEKQRERTRDLWQKQYPDVPFDVTKESISRPKPPEKASSSLEVDGASGGCAAEKGGGRSQIRYNIVAAAVRQGVFYYQVSLDHFRDPKFLSDAILRYKMYLHLKSKNKETFLVPCYDMDLIWHTHQLHPVIYQRETSQVLGFVLKHDDSVNDRASGSKLNNADEVTRHLWQDLFKVPFARPGSMFRGNPPQGKLFVLTDRYQQGLLAPKEMDVELNAVKMSSVPNVAGDNGSAIFTVQLETDTTGLTSKKKCIDLYSSECNLSNGNSDKSDGAAGGGGGSDVKIENPEGLVHFAVSHKNCPKLNLKLASKSSKKSHFASWFGNGRRASIATSEAPIDLFALMSNGAPKQSKGASGSNGAVGGATNGNGASDEKSNSDETLSVSHRLAIQAKDRTGNFITTELLMNLTNERLGPPAESRFRIQPGSFYECIIPEDVERMWGPIPLQKLPCGVNNKCRAVTHG